MANTFTLKEGDTRPTLDYTLRVDGKPIDLRNANSVRLFVEQESDGTLVINGDATIVDEPTGQVQYQIGTDQTLPIGDYQAEFRINWADGGEQTVPRTGYINIRVNRRIEGTIDPSDWVDPDITVTTVHTDNIASNTDTSVDLLNTLNANGYDVTGLPAPTDATDAARKSETDALATDVDSVTSNFTTHEGEVNPHGTALEDVRSAGNTLAGDVDFGGNNIGNVGSFDADKGPSNVYRPKPGEVQSTLNDATADGGGRVVLEAGGSYDPASPWEITDGVTLDFNGATVDLTTDTDVLHIHAGGLVLRPRVDFSGVTYTSNVYTFDAGISTSQYGSWKETGIRGGETNGTVGEGTVFYLHQNGASDRVTFVECLNHRVSGCETVVEIHSENVDGWCNTNTFTGRFAQASTCILQHGPGGNKYNEFEFSYQPNTNGSSAIFWDLSGAGAEGNVYDGTLWDTHSITDIVWRIGPSVDSNNMLKSSTPVDYAEIDNQSSATQSLETANDRARASPGFAVGPDAEATEERNSALGDTASATGTRSTAIGSSAQADEASVAIGQNADSNVTAGTAIGRGSSVTGNYGAALGYNVSNSVNRTFRIGDATYIRQTYMAAIQDTIADADLPNDHLTIELDETNGGFRLRGKDSTGTIREALIAW